MPDRIPLARLLAAATRQAIDELHAQLAEEGHPGIRPAHGYALVALGRDGAPTARLGPALGITKQGAAKLVAAMEAAGYVERRPDEHDRRAQRVVPTARGRDLLKRSVAAQQAIERRWAQRIGAGDAAALRRALEQIAGDEPLPLRPVW